VLVLLAQVARMIQRHDTRLLSHEPLYWSMAERAQQSLIVLSLMMRRLTTHSYRPICGVCHLYSPRSSRFTRQSSSRGRFLAYLLIPFTA